MKSISLTRGKVTLVDDEDYEALSKFKWHATQAGYAARRRTKAEGGYDVILYMHREILKPGKGLDVDHFNRNKLDNRRENLRAVSHQENMLNWRRPSLSTSGYRGVTWSKERSRWIAQIRVEGKNKRLGRFKDKEDAARAYDLAAGTLHGQFAILNFKRGA